MSIEDSNTTLTMKYIMIVKEGYYTNDGYEEVVEDFEVVRSSGKDRTGQMERSVEDIIGRLDRSKSQLKLKHMMNVSNFSGTLSLEDLISWIHELEDYFELEDIGDPLRVSLA